MRPSYAQRLTAHQQAIGAATAQAPYIFQTYVGSHNYVAFLTDDGFAQITRDGSESWLHAVNKLPCIKTIADAEIVYLNLDKNGNRRAKISMASARLGFLTYDEICEIMKSMGWRLKGDHFFGQLGSAHFFVTEYVNRAINGV